MTHFAGVCRGGPWDGTSLEHDRPSYKVALLRPIKFALPVMPPDAPLPLQFGHYTYVLGQWIWRED